jgi:hypothetical protein
LNVRKTLAVSPGINDVRYLFSIGVCK